MTIEELIEEFPYGIVVLEGNMVLHICSYPSEPTMEDCLALIKELKTDLEFGLTKKDFDALDFCKATGDLLRKAIDSYLKDDD